MEVETELVRKLEQDRKHNRRVFFWLIMIAIVLPVIAVVCAYFYDCAPPEDSDMRPQWTTVPLAENGLAQFEEWLEKHPVKDLPRSPELKLNEPTWKVEAAKKLIAAYQPALDEFDKLAETDIAKWRWKKGAALANFRTEFSSLTPLTTMGQLMRQRVKLLLLEGKPKEAADLGFKLMRVGRGLQTEGLLIQQMVAMTIQASGQSIVTDTIKADTDYLPDSALWRQFMSECEPQADALVFILKAEYEACRNIMSDIKSGSLSSSTLVGFDTSTSENLTYTIGLRPNRTLQLYLDFQRPVVRAAGNDWAAISAASAVQQDLIKAMKGSWWKIASIFLRGNPGGVVLMNMTLPAIEKIVEKHYSTIALHRITFTQFAIREYELANGKLPVTLGDLVPAQFPQAPVDPFDDKPLRWDATKKIIYSVGPDMIDAAGDIDEKSAAKGKDVGQKYWWPSPTTK